MPTTKEVDENRSPSKVFFTYNVDAVEVVRCKDCRYWSNNECIYIYFEDNPNGYCAWGERREDD